MSEIADAIGGEAAAEAEGRDTQVRGLNSDVRERLREAIKAFGGQARMASALGIRPGSLSETLSGKSEPRTSLVAKIAELSGTSLDWIMFGNRGRMALETPASSGADTVAPQNFVDPIAVPFFDIRVSAGPGANVTTEAPSSFVKMDRGILERLGLRAGNLAVHTVSGDSAEPTMSEGDYVLIDRSATELRDGGMYVIGIDDDVLVKRVERLLDGSIKLSSDNPRYSPQILPGVDAERLRVIGRVRWVLHQF